MTARNRNNGVPYLLLPALLLATMALSGCLGHVARKYTLNPVLKSTLPDIQGFARTIADRDETSLVAFSDAINAGDVNAALAVWPIVRADADRGIDAEKDTGPAAKRLGHEEVSRYDSALRTSVAKKQGAP
jgi:hypothetical protein